MSNATTMSPTRELTLIVAATSKMGIGLNGTLPWTGLKKEMAYFARVTKRVEKIGNRNAVIMGRKTWESIPPKFRPLKDRTNIAISRSYSGYTKKISEKEPFFQASSLEAAIQGLELDSATSKSDQASEQGPSGTVIEKTFIIGGGQIYKAALKLKEAKRILLTRVLDDFDCDTIFPVNLGEDGQGEGGWVRKEKAELDQWVGEIVPEGMQVEGEKGTRYVFEMWERD